MQNPHYSKTNWMPIDNIVLEPQALEIVKSNENICVLAGPGSGKTELLAQRIAYLLQTKTCPFPFRVLAISFKRDSATNLEQRALKRCGIELVSRFDSYTIDAFSKSILDRFRLALPENIRPIPEYKIELDGKKEIDNKITLNFKRIRQLSIWLIHNNRYLKNAIRQTFHFVLLDEFQDTTTDQYQFIKESFINSDSIITAVGDIKQTIMGFAGADRAIFSKFETDFKAKRIPLLINYRSKKKLQYIQSFFAHKLDTNVKIAKLFKDSNEGDCVIYNFLDANNEAEIITEEIRKFVKKGIALERICIVYRRKELGEIDIYRDILMNRLESAGIPARFEDVYQDFLGEPIIKLLIPFLRLALIERNADDWSFIQNLLLYIKGFNDETPLWKFHELNQIIHNYLIEIRENLFNTTNQNNLKKICLGIIKMIGLAEINNLYPQYIQNRYLSMILDKFCKHFWLQYEKQHNWIYSLETLLGKGVIPIMTIHKSKGLEFEIVIFIGLEDHAFFSYQKDRFSELCAFFVALSRAKSMNIFTFCKFRSGKQQSNINIIEIYDLFAQSGVYPNNI